MSWRRSYWFHVPLSKQLNRDSVGQVEAAINNVTTVFHQSHLVYKGMVLFQAANFPDLFMKAQVIGYI